MNIGKRSFYYAYLASGVEVDRLAQEAAVSPAVITALFDNKPVKREIVALVLTTLSRLSGLDWNFGNVSVNLEEETDAS